MQQKAQFPNQVLMKPTSSRLSWRIAGFRVTIDPLLPVVIILIGWLLSERYFPIHTIGYVPEINYLLGGIASILLTFSILFHELGHAIVAVRSNLQIERIHLFLFGGMAELKHRPLTPLQELSIAISGPLFSFLLAAIFWVIGYLTPASENLVGVALMFVIQINVLLGLFNLIPIFPLDGGRALRAFYWYIGRRYIGASKATLYTSYTLIGIILIIGVIDLMFYESGYETITILLAIYLIYTVFKGRTELMHAPTLEDYIYTFDPTEDSKALIDQVLHLNDYSLRRAIIPVLEDGVLVKVIRGQHVHNALVLQKITSDQLHYDGLLSFYADVNMGDFIDLAEKNTYDRKIRYSADFIPLLNNKAFVGLCDAYELRFWLRENLCVETHNPINFVIE